MAKCERREIKPEPPPVEFVLTLTQDEAEAVCIALGHFGGSPDPTSSTYDELSKHVFRSGAEKFRVEARDGMAPCLRRIKP